MAFLHKKSEYLNNERDNWYRENKKLLTLSQFFFVGGVTVSVFYLFKENLSGIKSLSLQSILFILIFPILSALYYGKDAKINIRKYGKVKPFIIGFCWAGIVTIYPYIFYHLQQHTEPIYNREIAFLFFENFIFISALCVLFDIKDFIEDSHNKLKTFAVEKGIKKTVFRIAIPLCVLGLLNTLLYAFINQFAFTKLILMLLPFVLTILFGFALLQPKRIIYFLFFIDGLMILKSLFGVLAMKF
jgi:hypothetical protein